MKVAIAQNWLFKTKVCAVQFAIERNYPDKVVMELSLFSFPGLQLNSLSFSSSYLATGSDDGVLRLWPLDLSAVFLEVEHEGPVKDITLSRGALLLQKK